MSEFGLQPRDRDFLILNDEEKKKVFKNPSQHHFIVNELIKARRLFDVLFTVYKEPKDQLKFLIDVYDKFYHFEKEEDGKINYELVNVKIDDFIKEIVEYYEDLIENDVPSEYKNEAELSEDVKGDVIQLIALANKKAPMSAAGMPNRSYQARLILDKLIDWLEINYRDGSSADDEADQMRRILNEEFFVTDSSTDDIQEGMWQIIRFYDIDNFLMTSAYAVFNDEKGIWVCYDGNGIRIRQDLEELRSIFGKRRSIYEETIDRKVRYFRNPLKNWQEIVKVYYHPRTKETPSLAAKMARDDTRDSTEVHDKRGDAFTVENASKVHICEKALEFIWSPPGIVTDYTDTFHKHDDNNLSEFSAPGMHIVKFRPLRPVKRESIIDILARNMDEADSIGLVNHRIYRYKQNMVKLVYKRLLPHINFDAEEIRKWVEYKVRHLQPLIEREDVILDRYGAAGQDKIKEIRNKAVDLLYNDIINLLRKR